MIILIGLAASYLLMALAVHFITLIIAYRLGWDRINRETVSVMGAIFWPPWLILMPIFIIIQSLQGWFKAIDDKARKIGERR